MTYGILALNGDLENSEDENGEHFVFWKSKIKIMIRKSTTPYCASILSTCIHRRLLRLRQKKPHTHLIRKKTVNVILT